MVERHLPKVNVASSNLVFRSMKNASFYEAFFFRIKITACFSMAVIPHINMPHLLL